MSADANANNLKHATMHGLGWTASAQLLRQVLQFAVSICLIRLLTPEDYGLLAMVLVFSGFAGTIADLGLGNALVQLDQVDVRDIEAVYTISLLSGIVITLFFILLSPLIAAFFNEPKLQSIATATAFTFFLSATSIVPTAILRRRMDFRPLAIIDVIASLLAGTVAIVFALLHFGVWSLVVQLIIASGCTALLVTIASGWIPKLGLDLGAIKTMWHFSSNLVAFNVTNYWIRNGDNLIIGRVLGTEALGIYTRAYGLMVLPITQINTVLTRVMFPLLSRIHDDHKRAKSVYLRSLGAISLITFPMMLGLAIVADHFVLALYGAQWVGVIPVLRILALAGMVQSVSTTVGWVYQATGRTDLMFRWGIASGVLLIGSIIVGVWWGSIVAVAICYSLMECVILLYPTFAIPGKLIEVTFLNVLYSVLPAFLLSLSMGCIVLILNGLLPSSLPQWLLLSAEVLVGVLAYCALIFIFRPRSYRDVSELLFRNLSSSLDRH